MKIDYFGRRRNVLALAAGTHFIVDLTCIWILTNLLKGQVMSWHAGYLLYNFLAFALQLPIGIVLDFLCEEKSVCRASGMCLMTSVLGCLLLIGAVIYGRPGFFVVLIAGFANAFFHIGCGADLLRLYDEPVAALFAETQNGSASVHDAEEHAPLSAAKKKTLHRGVSVGRHGAQGIFVPAGGFGLVIGVLLPFVMPLRIALVALLGLGAAGLSLLAKMGVGGEFDTVPLQSQAQWKADSEQAIREGVVPSIRQGEFDAVSEPGRIAWNVSPYLSPSRNTEQSFSENLISSVSMYLCAMLHSMTELSFSFSWQQGVLIGIVIGLCVVAGKVAGGLLADRYGIRTVFCGSVFLATLLLFLSGSAVTGWLALFVYHMSMPLMFSGMYDIFPERPAFSYGLVKFAIFVGYVPVYAGIRQIVNTPVLYAGLTFVSFVMAVIAFRRDRSGRRGKVSGKTALGDNTDRPTAGSVPGGSMERPPAGSVPGDAVPGDIG